MKGAKGTPGQMLLVTNGAQSMETGVFATQAPSLGLHGKINPVKLNKTNIHRNKKIAQINLNLFKPYETKLIFLYQRGWF